MNVSRLKSAVPYISLIAVILATYANALIGPFQFDDYDAIVDATPVHSLSAWWADLGRGLRPLLKLSYLFDWSLGFGAAGFHFSNLLIHALNALLVFRLAGIACARWLPQLSIDETQRAALVAALLFAVHPAQTEAVTYVSGRSVSLMSLLFLGSVLAYLHCHWLAALPLFVAALAVKEPAAVLPLCLLLLERTRLASPQKRALLRHALFWLLPIALGLYMVAHSRYREFLLGSLGTRSIADNLLTQLDALRYLLELLVGLRRPNIDPDLAVASGWTAILLVQALLLFVISIGAWRARTHRPWLTFGVFWFLITLLPTNSIFPRYDLVNDRQLYLPSVGFSIAIALELAQRGAFSRRGTQIAAALLLATLAAFTVLRNRDYSSEVALWTATVRDSPQKARPHNNLGYAYQLAGCRAAAAASYQRALAFDPAYGRALENLLAVQSLPATVQQGSGCPSG